MQKKNLQRIEIINIKNTNYNNPHSYQGIDHQIPMVRYKQSAWAKKNCKKQWFYGNYSYICRTHEKTLSHIDLLTSYEAQLCVSFY